MSVVRAAAVAVLATGCLSKPSFECAITIDPDLAQSAAVIGMEGGVPSGAVDCGGRPAVGVGFTMTHDPGGFGEKTAVTASLRCGLISSHDGDGRTDATEDTPLIGGFEQNLDGPFFADCPDGQVVIGLAAHIVGAGGLFNSIAIDCAAFDPTGAATGKVTRRPVMGTGTEPTDAEAPCGPDRALHGLESTSGSQLDRIELACAPAACTQP